MPKRPMLINEQFLPDNLKQETIAEKYRYFKKIYGEGANYILLNNVDVFGPFPEPEVLWDISEAQKIATYNQEVKTKILINLSSIDDRTLDVLIRIATGMLNKCDIPKELQIMFHDNMVENLRIEHTRVVLSDLPF